MWVMGNDCKYRWSLLDRPLLISCCAFLILTGQGPVMVRGLGLGSSATDHIYFLFGCHHDFLFSCQCFEYDMLHFFLSFLLPPFSLVFSKLFEPLVWNLSLCLKNPSVYFSFLFLSFVSFWDPIICGLTLSHSSLKLCSSFVDISESASSSVVSDSLRHRGL